MGIIIIKPTSNFYIVLLKKRSTNDQGKNITAVAIIGILVGLPIHIDKHYLEHCWRLAKSWCILLFFYSVVNFDVNVTVGP